MKIIVLFFSVFFSYHSFAVTNGMVYGETGRLNNFDPYTIHESSGYRLSDLLFNSLIGIDPGYEYGPSLAENWKISQSGTKVSFFLRRNVFWHRGPAKNKRELTAQDIVTTIKVITNSKSEITNADRFHALSHAVAINSHQVDVHLKYSVSDPLRYMMFKILPHHLFKKQKVLKRGDSFSKFPIGTGPYQFVSFSNQGEVLLSANETYFAGRPQINQIVMRNFNDQNIMSKSLMFSSLDLITFVSPRNLQEILGDQKLDVVSYDALSYSFIAFNNARNFLSDKRFRQALSFAINRKEMLEAFFGGNGELISGPFPPTSWAYNLDVKALEYNPSRSKMLLREVGYQDSSPLVFAVPLSGDSEMIKRIVLAYQNYLANIGVTIELKFMDWLVWKKKVLEERDFDLTLASWSFDDASNIKSLFHSSQIKPWGFNFVSYRNIEVDSLLTEAQATNDSQKRQAINHKLHAMIASDVPYTFLWTLKHHAAFQRRIHKVSVEPSSFFKHIVSWKISLEDEER